jgi:hypothetical protein
MNDMASARGGRSLLQVTVTHLFIQIKKSHENLFVNRRQTCRNPKLVPCECKTRALIHLKNHPPPLVRLWLLKNVRLNFDGEIWLKHHAYAFMSSAY